MKWTIVGSAILIVAAASSASADWQYTKWGMTPTAVTKASAGSAVPNSNVVSQSNESEIAKLKASYTAGEFVFAAVFMFSRSTDKLTGVHLDLADPSKCNSLRSNLLSKYGRPMKDAWSGGFKASTWQDRPSNMRIQIFAIGATTCEIIYAPLAGANNKGM